MVYLTQEMVTSGEREENDLRRPIGLLGEGTSTPLQCSCLENPMDGGAW